MRIATCRCGGLKATCTGEFVRLSVCHCTACQRRTGSAFSAQARFAAEHVTISGAFHTFVRTADSGNILTYRFCPDCGSTIAYLIDAWPELIAIPLGAFEEPLAGAPAYSIFERRKHPWVSITADGAQHHE